MLSELQYLATVCEIIYPSDRFRNGAPPNVVVDQLATLHMRSKGVFRKSDAHCPITNSDQIDHITEIIIFYSHKIEKNRKMMLKTY